MIDPTLSSKISHFPVMLKEVVKICSPHKGGIFLDCTFGGGGYSRKLLAFSKTKIIALDRDKHIINLSKELEKKYSKRFTFFQKKFSTIDSIVKEQSIDAAIFDLGLSSIQLKDLSRGFSFNSKEKLDMSMGLTSISAESVINKFSEKSLKSIIKILGDEKDASIIVKSIIKERKIRKITNVYQLVEIIKKSKKNIYKSKINPSTKTFQALRIFVNKEITELILGIINATKALKPGGKIVVVSFHSIEDKIVKYFFSNFSINKSNPSRYLPDQDKDSYYLFNKYKNKILVPSSKELSENPPSRSAKLRYAIRSNNQFKYPIELLKKFENFIELERLNV